MQIEDYETPDPYAPRPKASQTVAAQQRAQHHETEPIQPTALHSRRYAVPFGIGAALLILLMIGAASYQLSQLGGRPLAVTPGPSTAAFFGTPAAAPTASPAPTSAPTAAPGYHRVGRSIFWNYWRVVC